MTQRPKSMAENPQAPDRIAAALQFLQPLFTGGIDDSRGGDKDDTGRRIHGLAPSFFPLSLLGGQGRIARDVSRGKGSTNSAI